MLYRSTDDLCRRGAPMEYLAHSASFHSLVNIAPSKRGIKHLANNISQMTMQYLHEVRRAFDSLALMLLRAPKVGEVLRG